MEYLFDNRSPFIRNGVTGAWLERLNWRFETIFKSCPAAFEGKAVLDLGCNDGRWMHATLVMGARHVVGIDGRKTNIALATENLANVGYERSQYELLQADLRSPAAWSHRAVDTVLALGVIYHLPSPVEFLAWIAAMGPSSIIIDSAITEDSHPSVRLISESTAVAGNALATDGNLSIVSHPSKSALIFILNRNGYECETIWSKEPVEAGDHRSFVPTSSFPLRDYEAGRRVIIVAKKRDCELCPL